MRRSTLTTLLAGSSLIAAVLVPRLLGTTLPDVTPTITMPPPAKPVVVPVQPAAVRPAPPIPVAPEPPPPPRLDRPVRHRPPPPPPELLIPELDEPPAPPEVDPDFWDDCPACGMG